MLKHSTMLVVVFECGHKGKLPQSFKSIKLVAFLTTNNGLVTCSWYVLREDNLYVLWYTYALKGY
jgi:hypothetical protein